MIGNQQRILLKDTIFYFAYYNMYIINMFIISTDNRGQIPEDRVV